MLSPPPAAATSTRASKAGIVRTIEPCCSSAIHHAWRLHSRLHLGRKCRLEKVALVVRRSEAAGWRWSSSTLNECKPRFLGVAVMHLARTMATALRDSRSGRRQGSSSDILRGPGCGRPASIRRLVDGGRRFAVTRAVFRPSTVYPGARRRTSCRGSQRCTSLLEAPSRRPERLSRSSVAMVRAQ